MYATQHQLKLKTPWSWVDVDGNERRDVERGLMMADADARQFSRQCRCRCRYWDWLWIFQSEGCDTATRERGREEMAFCACFCAGGVPTVGFRVYPALCRSTSVECSFQAQAGGEVMRWCVVGPTIQHVAEPRLGQERFDNGESRTGSGLTGQRTGREQTAEQDKNDRQTGLRA